MKKIFIVSVILIIILSGCSKKIKPIEIIETDFDLLEAEVIMKKAWKPISEMTNLKLETRPDVPISSKEEFFDIYDFTYMSDKWDMRTDMYEALVTYGENGEEVKDNNGNLVFGKDNYIKYIPTIYDEAVFIKKAYIRETRYKEEYSYFNSVELVIEEESNYKKEEHASGFCRENVFIKNDKGKWILEGIQGTISIVWDR